MRDDYFTTGMRHTIQFDVLVHFHPGVDHQVDGMLSAGECQHTFSDVSVPSLTRKSTCSSGFVSTAITDLFFLGID